MDSPQLFKKTTRFFAQLIDYALLALVASTVLLFLPLFFDLIDVLVFALLLPFAWAPIEAFLISRFGTTFGRLLFGIGYTDAQGGRPRFWETLRKMRFWSRKEKLSLVQLPVASFSRRLLPLLIVTSLAFIGYTHRTYNPLGITSYIYHPVDKADWVSFKSPEGGYSVSLPKDPERIQKELHVARVNKDFTYSEYKSQTVETAFYTVSQVDLPKKWTFFGAKTVLKAALGIVIENEPDATLISKGFTTYQKNPVLDFRYKQGDKEVSGRLILIGSTLYKMTVNYTPDVAQETFQDHFLNSFTLIPRKPA